MPPRAVSVTVSSDWLKKKPVACPAGLDGLTFCVPTREFVPSGLVTMSTAESGTRPTAPKPSSRRTSSVPLEARSMSTKVVAPL